jgi:undecaprenyl-diphosphatase
VTYAQGAVLGLVQGLTEFLPVSSSGHLILVPLIFGWEDQGLGVDAALHLGTLAALVAYFRVELVSLLTGALPRRVGLLVIVATIPAALAGVVFGKLVEAQFRWPLLIAASTALWGVVMWIADRRAVAAPTRPGDPLVHVGWGRGVAIGFAQILALVPGTSRSGITISAGLFSGLDRATAARFSFLLGIPITAGAGALKLLGLLRAGIPAAEAGPLATGLAVSFVSGWFAVWFLVGYLRRGSLVPFVVYRLLLAAVIVVVTLVG